jgi:hypothetical protein
VSVGGELVAVRVAVRVGVRVDVGAGVREGVKLAPEAIVAVTLGIAEGAALLVGVGVWVEGTGDPATWV